MTTETAALKRHIRRNPVDFDVIESSYGWFWNWYEAKTWEPQTLALFERLLDSTWRLIDIGAWIGPTALFAAKIGAKVDAFECDPVALAQLRDNIGSNSSLKDCISVHGVAVGAEDGVMDLWSANLGNSESSFFRVQERSGNDRVSGQKVSIRVRDALSVFSELDCVSHDKTLVKIDVEGAEFAIIDRIYSIIRNSRCAWLISFHEINLVSDHIPKRPYRAGAMLNALTKLDSLNWYNEGLVPLDKAEVTEAILAGSWPEQGSILFSNEAMDRP